MHQKKCLHSVVSRLNWPRRLRRVFAKIFFLNAIEQIYLRAQHLCTHLEDPQQLFPVLRGLHGYYINRAELQTVHALGEQLLSLAQQVQDTAMLVVAHAVLGRTLFCLGAVASAYTYLTQGITLYDLQQHRAAAFLYGEDDGVVCHIFAARALWYLGYPDQGLARSQEAVMLAQQSAYPVSVGYALGHAAIFHQFRREVGATQERAEAGTLLAKEQGFRVWMAIDSILRGWALAQQGQAQEGITQIEQGLIAYRATGGELTRPYYLALLAEAYGMQGEPEEGLTVLTEALMRVDTTGERWYEAELYRLKGALLLQQNADNQAEAEDCFHQAIVVAQNQQAKSWELRAATSLAHLWQQQGKRQEAHDLLAPVYGWFTEGFDTLDLQDAKALLDALA
jgi:predicted ATPase